MYSSSSSGTTEIAPGQYIAEAARASHIMISLRYKSELGSGGSHESQPASQIYSLFCWVFVPSAVLFIRCFWSCRPFLFHFPSLPPSFHDPGVRLIDVCMRVCMCVTGVTKKQLLRNQACVKCHMYIHYICIRVCFEYYFVPVDILYSKRDGAG